MTDPYNRPTGVQGDFDCCLSGEHEDAKARERREAREFYERQERHALSVSVRAGVPRDRVDRALFGPENFGRRGEAAQALTDADYDGAEVY